MLIPEEDTFDKIEKNNPYKIEVESDEDKMLAEDLFRQAFYLQRKAYLVKFLAIIDFVSNILYGYYGYFLYIIFAACSFAGYMATINYSKTLLFFYLSYQIIQIVFKLSSLILLIALASSSDIRQQFQEETNSSGITNVNDLNYGAVIPLAILLLAVQLIITRYICDFYKYLPTRQDVRQII